jgi:hypothetical protein
MEVMEMAEKRTNQANRPTGKVRADKAAVLAAERAQAAILASLLAVRTAA